MLESKRAEWIASVLLQTAALIAKTQGLGAHGPWGAWISVVLEDISLFSILSYPLCSDGLPMQLWPLVPPDRCLSQEEVPSPRSHCQAAARPGRAPWPILTPKPALLDTTLLPSVNPKAVSTLLTPYHFQNITLRSRGENYPFRRTTICPCASAAPPLLCARPASVLAQQRNAEEEIPESQNLESCVVTKAKAHGGRKSKLPATLDPTAEQSPRVTAKT